MFVVFTRAAICFYCIRSAAAATVSPRFTVLLRRCQPSYKIERCCTVCMRQLFVAVLHEEYGWRLRPFVAGLGREGEKDGTAPDHSILRAYFVGCPILDDHPTFLNSQFRGSCILHHCVILLSNLREVSHILEVSIFRILYVIRNMCCCSKQLCLYEDSNLATFLPFSLPVLSGRKDSPKSSPGRQSRSGRNYVVREQAGSQ